MNKAHLPRVALIAGPTASGKSALAIRLAEEANGCVVNADASQVYRDLRILTARPSPADERRVPHRLFGHVDGANTTYSAARWAAEARAVIGETVAAGRLPVIVGGTGMYLRTLLDGIAPVPAIDPAIREAVRALPVADAHALLAVEDPPAAIRLAPADTTRVARALEVVRSTGRPLATWQAERAGGIGDSIDLRAVVLLPDRAVLAERIDARAVAMMAQGADAEVAALLARPDIAPAAPVRRAIGVAAIGERIAGTLSEHEVLALLQHDTRRYAKRQATWFRNQTPTGWFRSTENNDMNRSIGLLLRDRWLT
ncbi:tRNA (adenosine(37)-N6)-dimethylallyltransferase MiaA [uncultured Sphingomonas sp.]|uniref:tRNA (adenosine(37)-N6)-dimethylallyltransferase MiaA n=1 Tax=uncultured Sphingomonas sp. TaxID=158754 RepID=UPI0035CBFEDA